jgi:CHAD domain-containing protein
MSASDALIKFVRKHAKRLHRLGDTALQAGSVEPVHDVRVACRRLNEPMKVLRPWIAKGGTRTARQLAKWRRAFSDIRDADVLLQSLEEPAAVTAVAEHRGTLIETIRLDRERAVVKARGRIARLETDHILERIEALVDKFKQNPDAADLLPRVENMWGQRAQQWLDSKESSEDLHSVRIKLKRLRYCTELARRMGHEDLQTLVQSFATMQDCLGAWNDHVTASARLARLATADAVISLQGAYAAAVLGYATYRAEQAEQARIAASMARPDIDAAARAYLCRLPRDDSTLQAGSA